MLLPRAALAALAALILPYQIISSLDTVRVQRYFKLHVPFTMQPFTSTVVENEPFSGVVRGETLLAINGQAFRGNAQYLRALWDAKNQPVSLEDWRPLLLTIRTGAKERTVPVTFPNCTCGSMELWQAMSIWLIAPLFCVLLGFIVAWRNASSPLAWAFLAVALSMSQFDITPTGYSGFQLEATPMLWPNAAARILGVAYNALAQHGWPAAAVIAAIAIAGKSPKWRSAAAGLALTFAIFAALHAGLAVAWSENFRPLASVYVWVQQYETERLLLSFAAIAALGWSLDAKFGSLLFGLTLAAAAMLYADPTPITTGSWTHYANNISIYGPIVPTSHRTPELAMLIFTAGAIAAAAALRWRDVPLTGLALLTPLVYDAAARLGRYWYPLDPGPFEYWILTALAIGGVGLSLIARWVGQKSRSQP